MDQVAAVKRYYDRLESRLGYRYMLGGRKHFGYYPEGERLNFRLALLTMEARLGRGSRPRRERASSTAGRARDSSRSSWRASSGCASPASI